MYYMVLKNTIKANVRLTVHSTNKIRFHSKIDSEDHIKGNINHLWQFVDQLPLILQKKVVD